MNNLAHGILERNNRVFLYWNWESMESSNGGEECYMQRPLTCVEICAGAGGQALGLASAGFTHIALIEYEADYCKILKLNRPEWNVICQDVHDFDGKAYQGVDLLAGGVPRPPFSIAGKQLGKDDERDLFPEAIRLIRKCSRGRLCWKMSEVFWIPILTSIALIF